MGNNRLLRLRLAHAAKGKSEIPEEEVSEIIEDGSINLGALSKVNGQSELDNAKEIIKFIIAKANFYGTPEKIILRERREQYLLYATRRRRNK